MNSTSSSFKLGILVVFGVFIVIGIAVFALSKTKVKEGSANLLIWGTFSEPVFQTLVDGSSLKDSDLISIKYVSKDPSDFDSQFVEALAEGNGPDIVILRDDQIYKHKNKLFVIPFKNFPERSFRDKFIEEGEVFLSSEGIQAVPLTIDPLVMYWNRDIFSNNQISQPPRYWDEVYSIVEKVTKKDSKGNVLQSAIALGDWRNITNAKEIVSMLLLQAGNSITSRDETGRVFSVLDQNFGKTISPAQSSLNFYTQFTNTTSDYYSWNRSLPTSLNMFLGGNLALYVGFASEIFGIQEKNPNLNFDVTSVPQIRDEPRKTTFGRMKFFAITKQSKQILGAFNAINALTEVSALKSFETETNLPPVRRDMLSNRPPDAFKSVFYSSALVSRTWVDPNPEESSATLRDMIESITSGRRKISDAYSRANSELNSQLK